MFCIWLFVFGVYVFGWVVDLLRGLFVEVGVVSSVVDFVGYCW